MQRKGEGGIKKRNKREKSERKREGGKNRKFVSDSNLIKKNFLQSSSEEIKRNSRCLGTLGFARVLLAVGMSTDFEPGLIAGSEMEGCLLCT